MATKDYNNADYELALIEFNRLAALGNRDAIFNIGVMYLHGQGVEKDLTRAYAWFRIAADFGIDEARSAAQLIAQDLKDEAQLKPAYQALNTDYGYSQFTQKLQPIFSEHRYDPKQSAPPLRQHYVDAKYPEDAYHQGQEGWVWLEFDIDESGAVRDVSIIDAYPNNTFNRAIYNAVRRWRYAPLIVNGSASKDRHRSLIYHFTTFKGKRYQQSFAKQQREYQGKINRLIESAEQGNAIVQYYVANWLQADDHNATRLLKYHWPQVHAASDLLLASATNGYPESQYRLGASLLRGEYTQTNREKGLNWILYAAQAGFAEAQYRLARELFDPRFGEFDNAKAERWLQAAAEQSDPRAMRDYALLLVADTQLSLAEEYINRAAKFDDTHPDLLLARAQLASAEAKPSQAYQFASQALEQATSRQWHEASYLAYLNSLQQ
ncbi:hypothetical protein TUM4438_02980 [Shewanella sairae]|uniref:TonB C-terminal domain-containing protein n=1 Tax=Shewanella sairae TaxID=190310 RepID=A0ABQ4P0B5_9GAMM|nr:TonB family protein [Shewanella sairae]MCL1131799.1 TonB family protein [Shewanella sairae]GIU40831.1 hypothetical protein TUM4438_02980 [Shewanella sairae]